MADLTKDVDAIDRVLFRLASADDERMHQVVQSLLPQLIIIFPRSAVTPLELQLRNKILQVISHIKKRLQALNHPALPLDALSQVLQRDELSVFSYNLALLFIELGFEAAPMDEQTKVLAAVVKKISSVSTANQETIFRLLVRALPASASTLFPIRKKAPKKEGEQQEINLASLTYDTVEQLYEKNSNVHLVLDFLMDLVLYELPSSTSVGAMTYGLMTSRLERLQRVKVTELTREALYERQLYALKLIKDLEVPTKFKIPLYVAGSASYFHAVKAFSDEQLLYVIKYEEKELEDEGLMRRLMTLVLGSQVAFNPDAFDSSDAILMSDRTRLADASILQTLTLLLVSKAATNIVPTILQLLCHFMFGAEPSRPQNVVRKIKLASAHLCRWTLQHCQQSVLKGLLGPVLLPTFLRLLLNPHTESEASSVKFLEEFYQGIYETLSGLAARAPTLIASSEQAFQVLLVRCLAEEEHRTGAGANALKAFTSFARAYAAAATPKVRFKVQQELAELLNSSKLYDSRKNYVRVRAAIAAWCAELLTTSSTDTSDDISLRFAVLRLGINADEDTRRLAEKALFATPLPSTGVVAKNLKTMFPVKDLKVSMKDAGSAESCIRFCVKIMGASRKCCSSREDANDQRRIVEYILQTLLGPAESDAITNISVYETTASALVEVCEFDALSVGTILAGRLKNIFNAAATSRDRTFLLNISTIIKCSCSAGALTDRQIVAEIIKIGIEKLDIVTCFDNQLFGALYILGSALSYLGQNSKIQDTASRKQLRLVVSCYEKMINLLESKVQEGSKYASYPRSKHTQNEYVELLRSIMDGIGLSGTLIGFTQGFYASKCSHLKVRTLECLSDVVGWKLQFVHFDDHLSSKLTPLKRMAIENLGRVVSGLRGIDMSLEVLNGLEKVLNTLFELRNDTNCELQFYVGECLVSLGTHSALEKFAAERTTKFNDFAENRAAVIFERVLADYAGSRQPKVRRNATIWLLCICAAGLESSSGAVSTTSWGSVLGSPAYLHLMLKMHDFFVTMLNDVDEVSKESAVKGLAYLRLCAPTEDMGAQFSDSLFRRLRCFRAFASSADAVDYDERGNNLGRENDSATTTAAPSTISSFTVENAAYREVSNVAADVGDPELMYALLYLSTTNSMWKTFAPSFTLAKMLQSSLFSFAATDKKFRASIVAKAGSQWMTEGYFYKTKLVPWLFLLKFHSNSKVAGVMSSLWNFAKGNSTMAIAAKDDKMLLQQNWAILFQFSLARLENARNFKYREAACLALVDLLNCAEADDLCNDFLRLWKTASRAVDDAMEAVALSGVKLYKVLGELSLRVTASDAQCRSHLFHFLVEDGIASKNTICRELSIDVLLRLVETLKADDMQEHLAPLLVKLLEYLSSLEMPELQYAQFHVEKKDQLERLRVSISQAGPVGQLIELATTRLHELAESPACITAVTELVHGVANLLKFGVGLNTRVGTANFVVTLAKEHSYELRKCNGAELLLRRVLIPYVGAKTAAENDQYGDEESRYGNGGAGILIRQNDVHLTATSGLTDGLVIQSYCRAAAYLCPLVDAAITRDYVHSNIFAFNTASQKASSDSSPGSHGGKKEVIDCDKVEEGVLKSFQIYTSRYLLISALATKELVKKVPPIADAGSVVSDDLRNNWYCTHVFPAAFIGHFAATDILKNSWTTVLDELPPTVLYASNSLDAVLRAIALLLAHPAWDTRRQAAHALQAIFASPTYRLRLSMEQLECIWQELIDAVPGRLWKGKGVILESIVALAAIKAGNRSAGDNADDWMQTLSVLFVDESMRARKNHDLAYLESAIVNLGKFTALLPPEYNDLRRFNVRSLRGAFAEWVNGNTAELTESNKSLLPPLLIKCVFEALALMWPTKSVPQLLMDDKSTESSADTMLWLCASVKSPHFAFWSVRKAIFQAIAALAERAPAKELLEGQNVLERVLDSCCGSFGVADGKYSMVRVAAAGALAALLKRSGDDSDLALRLLVHRERVLAAMQTLLLSEEASEQRVAFNLKSQLLLET